MTEEKSTDIMDCKDVDHYLKKNYKGENVEAGREWVDAYVKYVIYVNGLYKTIQAGPAHGVGE